MLVTFLRRRLTNALQQNNQYAIYFKTSIDGP
jgi:hypothetical protein